ncbi:MAG: MarR family transcriptional regulator [bacterium]|nr:MarR family transcriptional regulator [bacterium]
MKTPESRKQLEALADEVYEVTKLIFAARARASATSPEELSESEFIALDLLTKAEAMTVGEIQKFIGILPAQMSRLLRGLEDKGGTALVTSSINPNDRRKVDVMITDAGRGAHERYRAARRRTGLEFLKHMNTDDREVFMRILRSFRQELSKRLQIQ